MQAPTCQLVQDGPDPHHFVCCLALQVAFMNDGSFLVADGYCNSRLVRFNPDGSQHSQYKLPDSSKKLDTNPDSGGRPMGVVHSVVLDECDGEVVLADRENMHVLRFDLYSNELRGESWGAGSNLGAVVCTRGRWPLTCEAFLGALLLLVVSSAYQCGVRLWVVYVVLAVSASV